MFPPPFASGFPKLEPTNHSLTSPPTIDYNCIAWAAGEDDRWWWPGTTDYYWPEDVPNVETVNAFLVAFSTLGYAPCADGTLEKDTEKVVLYVNAKGIPTHMARQLETGKWTSKLGRECDISHDTPEVISAGVYGLVSTFMARARR
jgi:hypothetical protein